MDRPRTARARALWHLLHEPDRTAFLIGPAVTDRHRVERAFAAELLAPAEGIDQQLSDGAEPIVAEQLASVAEHFDASEQLVAHQIENPLGRAVADA